VEYKPADDPGDKTDDEHDQKQREEHVGLLLGLPQLRACIGVLISSYWRPFYSVASGTAPSGAVFLAAPLVAEAQQAGKVARVGVLSPGSPFVPSSAQARSSASSLRKTERDYTESTRSPG